MMIFPQFFIYVLIYDYLKFRKNPSITSQEIANYISVALAVALSVDLSFPKLKCRRYIAARFVILYDSTLRRKFECIEHMSLV